MFKYDFLEQIFADEEMQKIPIGCQATAVDVFERLLFEQYERNHYIYVSELLSVSE